MEAMAVIIVVWCAGYAICERINQNIRQARAGRR